MDDDGTQLCQVTRVDGQTDDERCRVALSGELDNASTVHTQILIRTFVGDRRHVVIDLAGLTHLGSAGLAMFLRLRDELADDGGTLTLIEPHPRLLRLFVWTRLEHLLEPQG